MSSFYPKKVYDYGILWVFLLLGLWQVSSAQGAYHPIVVDEIILDGNKKTKDYVILRELEFSVGDTLDTDDLDALWHENEKRILSTGLFTHVILEDSVASSNHHIIKIKLQENWFIYPNVIFELADRNFNVWWNEQNRSLDRVNLGGRVNWINVSGHRDRLRLITQFGYTRKYDLEYGFPYLNKAKTLGIAAAVVYTENREKDMRL